MKRTLSIEEFVLKDCHLNKEQVQKLSVSLSLNANKVNENILATSLSYRYDQKDSVRSAK